MQNPANEMKQPHRREETLVGYRVTEHVGEEGLRVEYIDSIHKRLRPVGHGWADSRDEALAMVASESPFSMGIDPDPDRSITERVWNRLFGTGSMLVSLLDLIGVLVRFPAPEICRHDVACRIVSILEQNGIPGADLEPLAKALVEGSPGDGAALEALKNLSENLPL